MRRPIKRKYPVKPDPMFNSDRIAKFINCVMVNGKKSVAQKIVYQAFDVIKEKAKVEDPIVVFDEALRNVGPTVEVRSRRVGGANYQVPREVAQNRRNALAIRWIIEAASSKKGAPMHQKLADELIAAYKNEGEAIKKRENTHKMAEANKAFAHFAW
ncbi:MAG TPA: 30S ribosomal protein S7 [Candidatus Paceibacterota bacterium]|nr:30S ribosomal protein S7 [Candidatus Paceibacterota bacterium]